MTFVQILEGPDAQSARPVLATSDPRIVSEVQRIVSQRLRFRRRRHLRVTTLDRPQDPPPGEEDAE